MKKTILSAFTLLCFALGANAQEVETTTFTVYGNCGMCERTIEGAVGEKDGVSAVDWNRETHQLTITYDPKKITVDEVKEKIAAKGYDSDTHRATDKAYNGLPGCCKYERPVITE